MRNKKGAIELSMSTIVVVVIAIILLSLGIVFVKNMMGRISGTSESAFEEADRAIQDLMGGDEKFFISGAYREGKVGEKITFNSGIQNFEGETINFKIGVESKNEASNINWVQIPKTLSINAGDKKGFPIIVNIPKTAKSGSTLMYNIKVDYEDGTEYYSIIISINVK